MGKCKYWSVTQDTCVHPTNIIKPAPITTKEEAQKLHNKIDIVRRKKKGCRGCFIIKGVA